MLYPYMTSNFARAELEVDISEAFQSVPCSWPWFAGPCGAMPLGGRPREVFKDIHWWMISDMILIMLVDDA